MRSLRVRAVFRWVVAAVCLLTLATAGSGAAIVLPSGFQETTAFAGLVNPTVVRFAPDGRIFVAEKRGTVQVFDGLADTTPTLYADLRTNVHDFWDRGMLGLAIDPQFPARPYVYVSYTYNKDPNDPTIPRWPDACPNPPGATADGCLVSGRLSRLDAGGAETVLVEDWCQQYPSHSIGALNFGPDGALYMSGGDGASFNFADWGQDGSPLNPCGDPPGGVGAALAPPTAEGGALRAQDLRTSADPATLDGAIIRVDPDTGAARPDNPLAGSTDLNARRIIAYGLRNPFRFTFRPGTSELWIGDVGWNAWEEIDRVISPTAGVLNFGWPCHEGNERQPGYDSADLTICENLYASGGVTSPLFTYAHSAKVVAGEACPTGSSSIAGLAFNTGSTFPAQYSGALFFADYSRNCIWVMFPGANGVPDPATRQTFGSAAAGPVDLTFGPDGALYYPGFNDGTIRRIQAIGANSPPNTVASANPTSGPVPLTVSFDGTASSDPDGDAISYAWDLDADGAFDDSTAAQPSFTYTTQGVYAVKLRVTDARNASSTATVTITASGVTPTATIDTPAAGTTWAVGDTIAFSGHATDPQDGTLPAPALSWELVLQHCSAPTTCHAHHIQSFPGTASGSFTAPDHEYPSYLELSLTATDSNGNSDTVTRRLDPRTVVLTFESQPAGLQLTVGSDSAAAPFTREMIQGSSTTVSAPTPQVLGGATYDFASWSDGGARTHTITAGTVGQTLRATYTTTSQSQPPVAAYGFSEGMGTTTADGTGNGNTGTLNGATWSTAGHAGNALSFDGTNDWVTVADAASLDLTTGMTLEAWLYPTGWTSMWSTAFIKETTGDLVWGLYADNDIDRPSGHASTPSDVWTSGNARLALNAWTHLAATYDGATLRLYVNGNQVSSRALTGQIVTSNGPLRIGGNAVWNEWYRGRIDDLRVFNYARSPAEIQTDMNTGVGSAPPDTTPPSAPGTLTATGGLGQAQLSWGAATDDRGVARYDVHRSALPNFTPSVSTFLASTTATSYTDNGVSPGTWYYRVVAFDAANNAGPSSNEASATVTSDTTPPTVAITSPPDRATVSGNVNVTADASDDVGVASVQFLLDGQPLGAPDTSSPYSTSWNTATATPGDHKLGATARDAAGNPGSAAEITVTVSAPPPGQLVGSWGFEEASGTTVADSSGNGNTGTINGATRITTGHSGRALSFDGTNDWVTVADAASLDLTTGMTLEAWLYPTGWNSMWSTALIKEATGDLAYALYADNDIDRPSGHAATPTDVWTSGTARLPLNAWTHLAVTYDGANLRLYVNGNQASSRALTGAISTSNGPLRFGGNAVWNEWFRGRVDDVRVYSNARTQAEVQADMNTPVGPAA